MHRYAQRSRPLVSEVCGNEVVSVSITKLYLMTCFQPVVVARYNCCDLIESKQGCSHELLSIRLTNPLNLNMDIY